MNQTSAPAASTPFSDLLEVLPEGRPRLFPAVHPIPDLLELDAEEVLRRFKEGQARDFRQVIATLGESSDPLYRMIEELRAIALRDPGNRFGELPIFDQDALGRLFARLHEHVMGHPVWRHPFFVRIFRGEFERESLHRFALNYFNQVKNTRQCVALALGRFSGFSDLPYGCLNERVSELTQIVLAQLVADEYGVESHALEDYPGLGALFGSTTHIVMYRKIFAGLGIPFERQDVPMLPGVADNVLTQRLVAGHPAFSNLEALASVGLGMEWGVPEFFSLLLGGIIRYAWRHDLPLTADHLQVLIAHVKYDVLHAISVMLVTSFHSRGEADVVRIEGATNMLMAARYGMMSDLYRHVFDEACPDLGGVELAPRYHIADRRIAEALRGARAGVPDRSVVDAAAYRRREALPFVFADGV